MKSIQLLTSVLAGASLFLPSMAAAEEYDQNIVAIFGSGNPDTGWTTDTSEEGIVVALRAKHRSTGDTTNQMGIYLQAPGYLQPANNRAVWNWEFSISSGVSTLDAYDYYLGVIDPSAGIGHMVIDALTSFGDNSYGTSATLQGQGLEGPAAVYAGFNTVVQQSQNNVFAPWNQDPTINATYDYVLYAVAKGEGADGEKLASTAITVIVGAGGATVQQLIDELAAQATDHGEYVSAVSELTTYLLEGGVINKKQRQMYLTAAAKSSVGK